MQNFSLNAISPVDGRYARQTEELSGYFSEFALIRYRVRVEIEYFIALCDIPLKQLQDFPAEKYSAMREIYLKFSESDALKIKEIEKITNHDVKAVEYFIKDKFTALGLGDYLEFVHFGLTSQDINNTSVPLSLKEAVSQVYLPQLDCLTELLSSLANEFNNNPL